MKDIYRASYGLIFDDDFQVLDTERWLVSPSESYELLEPGLRLYHSDAGLTNILFDLPQDEPELVFEVTADYTPQVPGDDGGIVIWKSALEKLEFLESYDVVVNGFVDKWRVVKRNNLWSFFALKGGQWELVDSSICIDPIRAGIVLRNTNSPGFVPLDVKRAILCRGTQITVGNVGSGFEVRLLDKQGNIVRKQIVPDGFSGVKIELPSLPFEGKVVVVDNTGTSTIVHESEELIMYGGDEFFLGTSLRVIWRGKELDLYNPTNLGALKNYLIEEKMTLFNPSESTVAEDITVRVGIYNESFGHEWAELALDNNGKPGEYSKEIFIPHLREKGYRDFWVRIQNTTGHHSMDPAYFMLEIINY